MTLVEALPRTCFMEAKRELAVEELVDFGRVEELPLILEPPILGRRGRWVCISGGWRCVFEAMVLV